MSKKQSNIIDLAQRRNFQQAEALGDLLSDCARLYGNGPCLLIPGWNECFERGLVSIVKPDGEPLAVFLSRPLPDKVGLLLRPDDEEGGFTCSLVALPRDLDPDDD